MKYHHTQRKQTGSALFIMLMILVAMTILTFMATNMGKTDARISNAYAEHSKAFVNAQEMLARLRYALMQMPLPEGIAVDGSINKANRPIWITQNMVTKAKSGYEYKFKDGEPNYTDSKFAEKDGEAWDSAGTLTCKDLENWMKQTQLSIAEKQVTYEEDGASKSKTYFDPIDCDTLDPEGKTRTILELVSEKQSKSDVDDKRNTYYYRITIQGQGDNNGRILTQGVTGIQYN